MANVLLSSYVVASLITMVIAFMTMYRQPNNGDRASWILLILFFPLIGSIIYLRFGQPKE